MKSLRNSKVYVASTSKEPELRIEQHNNGSNTWSRQNGPFKLLYYEKYYCKKDAKIREEFYKMGFGKQIKYLIISKLKSNGV